MEVASHFNLLDVILIYNISFSNWVWKWFIHSYSVAIVIIFFPFAVCAFIFENYNVWMLHFPFGTWVWHAFTFRPFIFTKQVPQSPWLQLTGILTLAFPPTIVSFCPMTTPWTFLPFIETASLKFGPPASPSFFRAPKSSSLENAPLKASPNPNRHVDDIECRCCDGENPYVDPNTRREIKADNSISRNIFKYWSILGSNVNMLFTVFKLHSIVGFWIFNTTVSPVSFNLALWTWAILADARGVFFHWWKGFGYRTTQFSFQNFFYGGPWNWFCLI